MPSSPKSRTRPRRRIPPLDKVGFLFAADADGLVRPLNILFRDAANVEWIQ